MTTSVKVTAHCNPETTLVLITKSNKDSFVEEILLQDTESFEYYVYDDYIITVKEVKKEVV